MVDYLCLHVSCVCLRINQWDEKRNSEDERGDSVPVIYGKYSPPGGFKYISDCLRLSCVRRKEQSILSPLNCWNLLLLQVKRESRDRATLSDLYLNNIIPRFAQISEDSGRLFKKVRTNTHTQSAGLHWYWIFKINLCTF